MAQFRLPAFVFTLAVAAAWTARLAAAYDNPCTASWSGPDKNNEFSCDVNALLQWVVDEGLYASFVPIAIGLLFFIPGCCCVLISRYLCKCCGSANLRPGHVCCGGNYLDSHSEGDLVRRYSPQGIMVTKIAAIVCCVLGLVGLALSVVGGVKFSGGIDDVLAASYGLADWALGIVSDARRGLTDPSTGAYPPGFDATFFDDVSREVAKFRDDTKADYIDPYVDYAKLGVLVPAFVSAVPAALLLLPAVAALCSIRTGLPLFVILGAFPLQFIFLALGTALLVTLVPVGMLCDDMVAAQGERSVTQWLVIPLCEANLPFDDLRRNTDEMIVEASKEACGQMLRVCSRAATYDAASPDVVFTCDIGASADCTTLEEVQRVSAAMAPKVGAPETCGGRSPCPPDVCQSSCGASTARDAAKQSVSMLNAGLRAAATFREVLEQWMDCQALLRKVVSMGPRQACDTLRGGLGGIRDGVLLLGFTMIITVIVCLLGQKRFVNQSAYKLFADSDSSNSANVLGMPLQPVYIGAAGDTGHNRPYWAGQTVSTEDAIRMAANGGVGTTTTIYNADGTEANVITDGTVLPGAQRPGPASEQEMTSIPQGQSSAPTPPRKPEPERPVDPGPITVRSVTTRRVLKNPGRPKALIGTTTTTVAAGGPPAEPIAESGDKPEEEKEGSSNGAEEEGDESFDSFLDDAGAKGGPQDDEL